MRRHLLLCLAAVLAALPGVPGASDDHGAAHAQAVEPSVPPPVPGVMVEFFDVGQGSCALITCENDPPILVDCGRVGDSANPPGPVPTANAGAIRGRINEIMASYRDMSPRLIISHPDEDHYSMIRTVLADHPPRHVWFGGNGFGFSEDFQDYLIGLHPPEPPPPPGAPPPVPVPPRNPKMILPDDPSGLFGGWPQGSFSCFDNAFNPVGGLRAPRCGRARISIMAVNTPTAGGSVPNAASIVLNVALGNISATIAGDAEGVTENAAMRQCPETVRGTTILSASHHGAISNGSNGLNWAAEASAGYVVFQAGRRNQFGHPRFEAWIPYLQDDHDFPRTVAQFDDVLRLIPFGYYDQATAAFSGLVMRDRFFMNTRSVGSIRFRWGDHSIEPDIECVDYTGVERGCFILHPWH
ncbi:MAG: hypothetical protein H6891_11620 [Brucellaceae bacterium]|nr:hypothetical protein [Brucellaceae bacterium]